MGLAGSLFWGPHSMAILLFPSFHNKRWGRDKDVKIAFYSLVNITLSRKTKVWTENIERCRASDLTKVCTKEMWKMRMGSWTEKHRRHIFGTKWVYFSLSPSIGNRFAQSNWWSY